ncbi:MAG: DNA-binding protein WhiA [Eubacteriales bacterium]|nr:DNA-binding protein WhiA [Eubacteriales bacterium]MDD4389791.1 DNA-binding protein WhiA [Eubacteriales bacterium]
MSFSTDTKAELSRIDLEKMCCMMAEIAGFIRMCGVIGLLGKNGMKITLPSENPAIARHYKKLIKGYFDVDASLEITMGAGFKKGRKYLLTLDDREGQKAEPILRESGILSIKEGMNVFTDGIYEGLIKTKCCRKAYLRGLFLGGGTITDPEKAYHIEFICNTSVLANDVKKLISTFVDLYPRITQRGKNYIVYVKEADQVADILNILGAHNQFFVFEDVRVTKEMRNKANRLSNCDNANMDKTLDAASKQIKAINKIKEEKGLEFLSDKLREAAILRVENPESSLQELADMCVPPMKKSGLNNRLKKIHEIADKL